MSRRAPTLVAVTILALTLLTSTPAPTQEKKLARVVFVSLSWPGELPFRVAMARGYFKAQGLTIEPIFINGGPAAIAALISGDVDYASVGGAQAPIRSKARGLDLSIIANVTSKVQYAIVGNRETRTVESLRGKIVGVTGAGAFSDFSVRAFLKKNNLEPDKDVILRAIGPTSVRAAALDKGIIAAAPFSPDDTVRLMNKGFPLIVNLSEALNIPQSFIITRGEVLTKFPETTKRMLKGLIRGLYIARTNKREAIRAGYEAGLKGDPEIINRSYDLFAPAYTSDLSISLDGLQVVLDADIRSGLVDPRMTLDKIVNDRILRQAQQELRKEGSLP